ncbi:hypothetical protein CAPTEDRAFT_222769 [Capitella teleta]|uniref:VWFA domain-containing protein n=1 Tax=Capitella teleta TaxID=283909 RepID=R7U797_CAPTE|nr:hypothetical protein CAPTEDRAFT_222769 [Capitella teleta]|eukprot:ELT99546.1 hypothetical protein CAPTEDRAFT_222769 [Capitella teleta]
MSSKTHHFCWDYVKKNPEVYSLHIRSDITFRFATTHVVSRLANHGDQAKEAEFKVTLPKAAFISNFTMEIDDEVLVGDVKEKSVAKKAYTKAKNRGQSAGKVSQQVRDSNSFRVVVNVAARSKIDFNLTYEELLHRRFGIYEHVIDIDPGQVVRDLRVDVKINLKTIFIDNHLAVVDRVSSTEAHVIYHPSVEDQLEASDVGIQGQFVVQYDVKRDLDAGEIQVVDGYFVHFFAPTGLDPVNKNVLFILDVSGSMAGAKISQTKDAMKKILSDLRSGDMFNIITFSTSLKFWHGEGLLPANEQNKRKAKEFIKGMKAEGGTNINDALLRGVDFLSQQESLDPNSERTSMLMFLTDGEPTAGITSTSRIMANLRASNGNRFTLFSLGFGTDVDFTFLQKVSLQNRGLARKIYTGADADLQLEGFYSEVSTPVMSDIKIRYLEDSVSPDSVTTTDFSAFFRGSEIVVAGKLTDRLSNLNLKVSGGSARGYMSLDMSVKVPKVERESTRTAFSNFTEKLWAYMTIKKLDKSLNSSSFLDFQYNFVTPLTSMVIVKPDEPTVNSGELLDKEAPRDQPSRSVDNDPHFIVRVDGLKNSVCYDINGVPGTIFQLLQDRKNGIAVNGKITGKPPTRGQRPRTYLGVVSVVVDAHVLVVTPYNFTYNSRTYSWKNSGSIDDTGIVIRLENKKYVEVTIKENTTFRILRHLVRGNNRNRVDFLGFYIHDGSGLSEWTHGLIGQFLHQQGGVVDGGRGSESGTRLAFFGPHSAHRTVDAHLGSRRNMEDLSQVPCWHVRNNGRGLIKGKPQDYVVSRLDQKSSSLRHIKYARQLFVRR